MEKYFHVDHAMRTCITASTNLVAKSQRYAESRHFLEKLITRFLWKQMLLCSEYCDEFVDVLIWIWQENGRKNFRTVYGLFGHWNTTFCLDFRHLTTLLVTRSVFLLSWRWRLVDCALNKPQNVAVLKRRWPRTSDTAIWASRKFAGPYVWTLLPGARHWNSSVGFAPWPFGGNNTTWIFDCLNRSCIKGLPCCLDGLLHVPAWPRQSQIKKLCGGITIGSGGLPRFGAYAGGGILLSTKFLTSASLVLFSESQTL